MLLIILLNIVSAHADDHPTSINNITDCEWVNEQAYELAPEDAQTTDGYYSLGITGEPDVFLPGELYTVSLNGIKRGHSLTPFIGFIIWAEELKDDFNDTESDENAKPTTPPTTSTTSTTSAPPTSSSPPGSSTTSTPPTSIQNHPLGSFQPYDFQSKILKNCTLALMNATDLINATAVINPTVLINATGHAKIEVQVLWNAPTDIRNTCIRICARIDPVNISKTWSVLVRKICIAPSALSGFTQQPRIIEPCCACDEAKYEVAFESLWSRNTHPREFPPESYRAHFGDVIGASHTVQYRVWQEGRIASTGLKHLADDGSTTELEKELKAESNHIRTIIKARGISWRQVAGMGNPNTFAVFRVDARKHLMSLAAKLAPSPDWIVGVSALELCAANCTWISSLTLPLYPYDAGTNSGLSYTSRPVPTIPAVSVRALRPNWPHDARSPFFNSNKEMRPFGRVRLTRLRLYEKSCGIGDLMAELDRSGFGGVCATYEWEPWGPCSVTCGVGRMYRQRHYVWPAKAYLEDCRVPLSEHEQCNGPRVHCRAISDYEPDPAESSGPCAVSTWSAWSPCEGCGVRARTRHYLVPRAHKRCHIGFRARTVMHQAIPCDAGPCQKPPKAYENATNFDWFFIDIPRGECPVTHWGEWSPCSARCGRGRRLRTRLYVSRNSRTQQLLTRRQIYGWNKRFAELQSISIPNENLTSSDPEVDALVQDHLERCQFTLTQQEALCDGPEGICPNETVSAEVCKLPMSVGYCRGYEERWFYEWATGLCEPFGYTGCGGNANNFRTYEHCLHSCSMSRKSSSEITTVAPVKATTKKLKPTPLSNVNEVMQNDTPLLQAADISSCEIGPWLGWGHCFGDCDRAIKLNYRLVRRKTAGSLKHCGELMKSQPCKPRHCKNLILTTTHATVEVN